MQVHAAARRIRIGLRHEGGFEPVPVRDALHDALEADSLVAGLARIGDVAQVHFPLARAALGECGAGRHALRLAGRRDLREDVGHRIEVRHRIDLRARLATARVSRTWGLRVAGGRTLDVDEIELELDRDHRRPAARGIAVEHRIQRVARVAVERPAVVIEHLHLQLRDARSHPWGGVEGPGNGYAGAVGVALVEPKAGGLDRAAEDVEGEHRTRQEHAPLIDARQVGPVDALAAQHAAEIGEQEVDDPHRRTRSEESLGIRKLVADQGHASPAV